MNNLKNLDRICVGTWHYTDLKSNPTKQPIYYYPTLDKVSLYLFGYGLYEGANLHYRVSFASHALYVIRQELSSRNNQPIDE